MALNDMTLGDVTDMSADTLLVRDSEPVATPLGDNVVLLSIRAGSYFRFNSVGAQIWDMLSEPQRVGDICDVLAQQHGAVIDTVTRDVGAFLDTLIERRLVRVVHPDEPE
jgi:hypothetical protein